MEVDDENIYLTIIESVIINQFAEKKECCKSETWSYFVKRFTRINLKEWSKGKTNYI